MKTASDIVYLIEKLGARFGNLEENQTSNLKINLGLSNLGIAHRDPKFQDSFSNLLNEMQEVYEEFKNNPASTHWDLEPVYNAVEEAVSLLFEILDLLAMESYKLLDSSTYIQKFAKSLESFSHLTEYNSRDPINISILNGGDYSFRVHGERLEIQERSSNAPVRINQFLSLLYEIQKSYHFLIKKLSGDFEELLENLEIANKIPPVDFQYNHLGEIDISTPGMWNENWLPGDELLSKIEEELLCIDRLYLGVTVGEVGWADMLWHLESIFDSEYVRDMTQFFAKEDGFVVTLDGQEKSELNYLGISEGLKAVRDLEKKYESWYSEYLKRKIQS